MIEMPFSWSKSRFFLFLFLLNGLVLIHGLWVPYYNIDELTNGIYARFLNEGRLNLSDFLGNTYLLTHYLYAWVFELFQPSSLLIMHVVHILWRFGTAVALYFTGEELYDERTGRWAAVFYTVFSICFMSKDFQTPSAESFCLLPTALSCLFYFRGLNQQKLRNFVFSAVFAAVATHFKTPIGIISAVTGLSLLIQGRKAILPLVVYSLTYAIILIAPALFIQPFGSGFQLIFEKLSETNSVYIQSHEGLSFLYWILKFVIRTLLILGSSFFLTAFAIYAGREVFWFFRLERLVWYKVFFLVLFLMNALFVVTIGKRIFYHYYTFIMIALPLLGAWGLRLFDLKIQASADDQTVSRFYSYLRSRVGLFIFFPLLLAFTDGAFNFSTMPRRFDEAVQYIKDTTKETDQIYIWGNVPQVYFYSARQPSTVYFWSDTLAGTSPGSPAMEYVKATGQKLNTQDMLAKDFQLRRAFQEKREDSYKKGPRLSGIADAELFTVEELLERIEHPYWKKVFHDFLNHPPVLFIDTSPANIRGFGYFEIEKYELLKRFVWDNYTLEGVKDGLVFYRLKDKDKT